MIADFPKIECPFVRKTFEIDHGDWKKHGSRLGLREPSVYLITPEVTPGYDWVIEHKDTFAVEKLHGSNLGVTTGAGRITHIQNRMNEVDMLQVMGGRSFLVEAIIMAVTKDYVQKDGTQYGEALGPKLNGNMYQLPYHLWYPFDKAQDSLRYTSFHKQERSFASWNLWFHKYLKSLFYARYHKIPISEMFGRDDVPFAEGVVFYNPTIAEEGCRPRMSKLRRDMYPWHYWDAIHIKDLDQWALDYALRSEITPKGY